MSAPPFKRALPQASNNQTSHIFPNSSFLQPSGSTQPLTPYSNYLDFAKNQQSQSSKNESSRHYQRLPLPPFLQIVNDSHATRQTEISNINSQSITSRDIPRHQNTNARILKEVAYQTQERKSSDPQRLNLYSNSQQPSSYQQPNQSHLSKSQRYYLQHHSNNSSFTKKATDIYRKENHESQQEVKATRKYQTHSYQVHNKENFKGESNQDQLSKLKGPEASFFSIVYSNYTQIWQSVLKVNSQNQALVDEKSFIKILEASGIQIQNKYCLFLLQVCAQNMSDNSFNISKYDLNIKQQASQNQVDYKAFLNSAIKALSLEQFDDEIFVIEVFWKSKFGDSSVQRQITIEEFNSSFYEFFHKDQKLLSIDFIDQIINECFSYLLKKNKKFISKRSFKKVIKRNFKDIFNLILSNILSKAELSKTHQDILERSPKVQLREQSRDQPQEHVIELQNNCIQVTYFPDSLESRSKGASQSRQNLQTQNLSTQQQSKSLCETSTFFNYSSHPNSKSKQSEHQLQQAKYKDQQVDSFNSAKQSAYRKFYHQNDCCIAKVNENKINIHQDDQMNEQISEMERQLQRESTFDILAQKVGLLAPTIDNRLNAAKYIELTIQKVMRQFYLRSGWVELVKCQTNSKVNIKVQKETPDSNYQNLQRAKCPLKSRNGEKVMSAVSLTTIDSLAQESEQHRKNRNKQDKDTFSFQNRNRSALIIERENTNNLTQHKIKDRYEAIVTSDTPFEKKSINKETYKSQLDICQQKQNIPRAGNIYPHCVQDHQIILQSDNPLSTRANSFRDLELIQHQDADRYKNFSKIGVFVKGTYQQLGNTHSKQNIVRSSSQLIQEPLMSESSILQDLQRQFEERKSSIGKNLNIRYDNSPIPQQRQVQINEEPSNRKPLEDLASRNQTFERGGSSTSTSFLNVTNCAPYTSQSCNNNQIESTECQLIQQSLLNQRSPYLVEHPNCSKQQTEQRHLHPSAAKSLQKNLTHKLETGSFVINEDPRVSTTKYHLSSNKNATLFGHQQILKENQVDQRERRVISEKADPSIIQRKYRKSKEKIRALLSENANERSKNQALQKCNFILSEKVAQLQTQYQEISKQLDADQKTIVELDNQRKANNFLLACSIISKVSDKRTVLKMKSCLHNWTMIVQKTSIKKMQYERIRKINEQRFISRFFQSWISYVLERQTRKEKRKIFKLQIKVFNNILRRRLNIKKRKYFNVWKGPFMKQQILCEVSKDIAFANQQVKSMRLIMCLYKLDSLQRKKDAILSLQGFQTLLDFAKSRQQQPSTIQQQFEQTEQFENINFLPNQTIFRTAGSNQKIAYQPQSQSSLSYNPPPINRPHLHQRIDSEDLCQNNLMSWKKSQSNWHSSQKKQLEQEFNAHNMPTRQLQHDQHFTFQMNQGLGVDSGFNSSLKRQQMMFSSINETSKNPITFASQVNEMGKTQNIENRINIRQSFSGSAQPSSPFYQQQKQIYQNGERRFGYSEQEEHIVQKNQNYSQRNMRQRIQQDVLNGLEKLYLIILKSESFQKSYAFNQWLEFCSASQEQEIEQHNFYQEASGELDVSSECHNYSSQKPPGYFISQLQRGQQQQQQQQQDVSNYVEVDEADALSEPCYYKTNEGYFYPHQQSTLHQITQMNDISNFIESQDDNTLLSIHQQRGANTRVTSTTHGLNQNAMLLNPYEEPISPITNKTYCFMSNDELPLGSQVNVNYPTQVNGEYGSHQHSQQRLASHDQSTISLAPQTMVPIPHPAPSGSSQQRKHTTNQHHHSNQPSHTSSQKKVQAGFSKIQLSSNLANSGARSQSNQGGGSYRQLSNPLTSYTDESQKQVNRSFNGASIPKAQPKDRQPSSYNKALRLLSQ